MSTTDGSSNQYPNPQGAGGYYFGNALPLCLVIPSTALRLWAELRHNRNRLALDDGLIVLATLLIISICATSMYLCSFVVGVTLSDLGKEKIKTLMHGLYAVLHLITWTSTLTKLSVLALYHRAFPSETLNVCIWIAATLSIGWLIGFEVTWFLLCNPIRKFWHFDQAGYCRNMLAPIYVLGSFNVAIDLGILILPLPLIAKMRITRHQKILLCCLFSVGLATCAIGAARIPFSTSYSGLKVSTLDGSTFGLLGIWECTGGILCANLPIVYKHITTGIRRVLGLRPRDTGRLHPTTSPQVRNWYQFQRMLRRKQNRHWEISTEDSLTRPTSYSDPFSYSDPIDAGGILMRDMPKEAGASARTFREPLRPPAGVVHHTV
ncbi:uncharacterized protein DSM5745_06188 [Aspergillus mulundensis]|uniref:Rhodopsin domain-containing protein n=1 Tax=Aspergillus mulundensis TaxID=1810919 RepID=A0A3D8RZ75_9EURO|nr:hypothetical protein DSM5745_06188 [Aspergillus mulundensis]RDW79336.1 hypothetical protein DSM5745_06188 [Aspergillus mulundensis]